MSIMSSNDLTIVIAMTSAEKKMVNKILYTTQPKPSKL